MSTLTATAFPALGYVRVDVDFSDVVPVPRSAFVSRVLNGVSTALRDGYPAPLSNGMTVLYDTEIPLDTAVTYRASTSLNANGTMEDGVDEWLETGVSNGTVGTPSQSFDYYVRGEGRASLKLVPPGGSATARVVSEAVPATVGVSYSFQAKLMLSALYPGTGVYLRCNWYNGTTYLGNAGTVNGNNPTPGEFETYSFNATAPASTTHVRLSAELLGTPPKTVALYVDEAYITRAGVTSMTSGSATLASNGNGWWKDPLHPATMVQLLMDLAIVTCGKTGTVYGGLGGFTRAADNEMGDVVNSSYPVGVWGVRKAFQSQMLVGTATAADQAAVEALHEPGAPLLLQLPSVYSIPEHYQLHGDLSIGYLGADQRKPWRRITSGFARMEAPAGPAEGVFGARYVDINRWATYAAAGAGAAGTTGAYDTFNRTVASGLGTADSGQTYTLTGTPATEFNVGSGLVSLKHSSAGTLRLAQIASVSLADAVVWAWRCSASATPVGGNPFMGFWLRGTNANNHVEAQVFRDATNNQLTCRLLQVVGGTTTATAFTPIAGSQSNSTYNLEFRAKGTALSLWVWVDGGSTGQTATPTVTQTVSYTTAGPALFSSDSQGVTNLPWTASMDEWEVGSLAAGAGNTWLDLMKGAGHV